MARNASAARSEATPVSSGRSGPVPAFSTFHAVVVVLGVVVGMGIFRLPPLVAANAGSVWQLFVFWAGGGLICLLGGLVYAELAARHPDAGGEYHFLDRAYGSPVAFLFGWGRMTVMQTGSIALAAFIFGDYASRLFDFGALSTPIYAAAAVVVLTAMNWLGTELSKPVQSILALGTVAILLAAAAASAFVDPTATREASGGGGSSGGSIPAAGQAMIFVLLTYGGWNEAAYLSGEMRGGRWKTGLALVISIGLIMVTYLCINAAYVHVLGLKGLSTSKAVSAELVQGLFGPLWGDLMAIVVVLATLSTLNATIITGARTNYAVGRDFRFLRLLGRWRADRNAPGNALVVQGAIALALVVFGTLTGTQIETMVNYTAPVFWLFVMLTVLSLFVFRFREGALSFAVGFDRLRASASIFAAVAFILVCFGMLYSSLAFTGLGALVGAGILLSGFPVLLIGWWACPNATRAEQTDGNHAVADEVPAAPGVHRSEP